MFREHAKSLQNSAVRNKPGGEEKLPRGAYTDGKCTHEEILNLVRHQGNANKNPNEMLPTHLSQRLKLRSLTTAIAGEDVSNWNSHTLLVGVRNSTRSPSARSLTVSCRSKRTFMYGPSIPFLDNYCRAPKAPHSTEACSGLFIIGSEWKQPQGPLAGERISRLLETRFEC